MNPSSMKHKECGVVLATAPCQGPFSFPQWNCEFLERKSTNRFLHQPKNPLFHYTRFLDNDNDGGVWLSLVLSLMKSALLFTSCIIRNFYAGSIDKEQLLIMITRQPFVISHGVPGTMISLWRSSTYVQTAGDFFLLITHFTRGSLLFYFLTAFS